MVAARFAGAVRSLQHPQDHQGATEGV